MENKDGFFDYAISGTDIRAYALIRKGLVHETVSDLKGYNDRVIDPTGNVVRIDDNWISYEIGMLRMMQYSATQSVNPIIIMTAGISQGNAVGRSFLSGRMVFRNTNKGTLADIKNRILDSEDHKITISTEGFGVDFEEDITADSVNDAEPITDNSKIRWSKMPPIDILLVASDEREIEYPRVFRFKDVVISDTGGSEGATDTEENEFCNFLALSGHTPWRTLRKR